MNDLQIDKGKKLLKMKKNVKVMLIIILLASLIFTSFFSFAEKLPITQTDGASHYVYAKIFSETLDLNSDLPQYNYFGSLERKVKDYMPFTLISLGLFLRIFKHDLFFMNGFFGGLFFVLASTFFYLLSKRILNSENLSLIATMFFILNIRAYIFLFSGILPAFIAFCLMVPALYFTYLYLEDKYKRKLIFAYFFSFLTSMTYFPIFVFLLLSQICLAVGFYLQNKLKVNFPKINYNIRKFSLKHFKKQIYLLFASFCFLLLTLFFFVTRVSARGNFIKEYVASLLSQYCGLFLAWKNPFILDGPIITTFFIIGLVYILYKNNWKLFALALPTVIYFIIPLIFFPKEVFLLTYLFRSYLLCYAVMVIVFLYIIKQLVKCKEIKKIIILLLICSLFIQLVKLGLLFSMIEPSISEEQKNAAIKLSKIHNNETVLFINNMEEVGSFKSSKWLLIFSKPDKFIIQDKLRDSPSEKIKYIFIADANNNYYSNKKYLENFEEKYNKGSIIYQRVNKN